MPRIAVPDGQDPLMHLWGGAAPGLSVPAARFSDAVYNRSTLPLGEMEASRITVARINDCNICRTMRSPDGPGEAFYEALLAGQRDAPARAGTPGEREALASEFAERFATDHLAMDDGFWE